MNIRRNAAAVVCLGMVFCLFEVQAQRARNDVQPAAIKAMETVGAKLRNLDGYSVEMDVETTTALGDGRYRQFKGTVQYLVKPPGHLAAAVNGDGISRRVFYDGTNIIVLDPARQTYARVEAPGNLQTLLDRIKSEKGISLPIADLFTWGATGMPMSAGTRARYEGTGMVGGQACEHYSYLAGSVAWDVWVSEDDLPCKLVMVDMADRGLPGYQAEMTWNTERSPKDSEFSFAPAPGATEVSLAQMAPGDEAGKP